MGRKIANKIVKPKPDPVDSLRNFESVFANRAKNRNIEQINSNLGRERVVSLPSPEA